MKPSTLFLIGLGIYTFSPALSAAEAMPYKTVGEIELSAHVFKPEGWTKDDNRAAAIFFHGGGWRGGKPDQFFDHCRELASDGMVTISFEYRLSLVHDSSPKDSTEDARSAMRWTRANAGALGIDPAKIVAGGGSAGGQLAAALATLDHINSEDDNLEVPTAPAALLLFNPALKLDFPRAVERAAEAKVPDLLDISPFHHIDEDSELPPTIIFHGEADETVPISSVEAWRDRAVELGGSCQLRRFPDCGHGFFNRGEEKATTIGEMVKFLRDLELL